MSIFEPQKTDRQLSYQPMVLVAICFAIGIVCDLWCDLPVELWIFTALLCPILWSIFSLFSRRERIACVMLYTMLFASGGLWHHVRWNWFGSNEIGKLSLHEDSESCVVRGSITSAPMLIAAAPHNETLDTMPARERIRFRMQVQAVRNLQQWCAARGQLQVTLLVPVDTPSPQQLLRSLPRPGDDVEVVGSLYGLRPASNPGQFEFADHFRSRGQLASMYLTQPDAVQTIVDSTNNDVAWPVRLRESTRGFISDCLERNLKSPHSEFASAVLLGNREQMEFETRQRFLQAGASHLLAISGLHVGILAGAFLLLYRFGLVSRRSCLLATIAFVLAYAWLVEFRPTVLRASILIFVMCVARLMGRTSLSWGSLMAALLLVLLVNPCDIRNLGTQLSFLAISSIIVGKNFVYPTPSHDPVEQLIARTRSTPVQWLNYLRRQIRAAFCVSALIWLMGLPLVAYHFHSIALVAPFVNPLLLLPMAMALYFGLATIIFGATIPWLAPIPGFFCGLSLWLIQVMIDFAASIPQAHFWTGGPSGFAVIIFYVGIFFCMAFPATRLPVRWNLLLMSAWFVFGWLIPDRIADFQRRNERQLEVIIIDVRHGSAALLKLPDGRNILCDGGSLSGSSRAERTISELLWHEGVSHLDAVLVSHADVDHFNGVPGLVSRFSVGEVWMSSAMIQDESRSVKTLMASLNQHGVPVRTVGTETKLAATEGHLLNDGFKLEFLGPPMQFEHHLARLGDNALSVVLKISWKGRSILLPGDLEKFGMNVVLGTPTEKVDLLVAAHHGSKNSAPERFARWCQPTVVVASCGKRKVGSKEKDLFRIGHNCSVLTTDEHGAIRFLVDDSGEVDLHRWDGGWKTVEPTVSFESVAPQSGRIR